MTDHPDRPDYSFDPGPPPEASRYLRNKGLQPSFSWQDVEPEEHAVAFAVAKMAETDMLQAAKDEVQKALDQGTTFAAFQKSWRSNPKLSGWWGRETQIDPQTGEEVEVQLGSPRRLKTIYRANLRSARAAGQWERIERTKQAMPFLLYQLGPSERRRPDHRSKEGLILRVDDPFWNEWMPPNGWGCKCWVRQLSRREAGDLGGEAQAPRVEMRPFRNARTGEVREVPRGIDPGWDRNPGKLRLDGMSRLLEQRLIAMPEAARDAALRDIATSWRLRRMIEAENAVGDIPLAILPGDLLTAAGGADAVVKFSNVSRDHIYGENPDRSPDDLRHAWRLGRADRIALQRRPGENPRLIFELVNAATPGLPANTSAAPLRFVVVVKAAGSFVNTHFRTSDRRWTELTAKDHVTVLKE